MKQIRNGIIMKIFSMLFVVTLFSVNIAAAKTLTLFVNSTSDSGTVRAALFYNQDSFDTNDFIIRTFVPAKSGLVKLRFEDLDPGVYGIAVFHDKNGNLKFDRNLVGMPKEPFGFSRNPKIGFSAPKFSDFNFKFDGTPQELEIILNGN